MNKRFWIILSIVLSVSVFLSFSHRVFATIMPVNASSSMYRPIAKQVDLFPHVPLYNELISETLKFTSPKPITDSRYGRAVAVYSDTLIVSQSGGGNHIPGNLFIYERNVGGVNNWGITTVLTPSDEVDGHGLGSSISFDGETLLAGSATAVGNVAETGAAYIFERDAGGSNNWGEVAKLIAPDGETLDRFGWSVSLDVDTAVIGARWHDGSGINQGSVYIYERNFGGSNNWGFVKEIVHSEPANYDRFGYAVAVEGDTIAVGADGEDTNGNETGVVYLFERNTGGSENWGEVAQVTPDEPLSYERFGVSIKFDNDRLAVGAIELSANGPGAVYIFERNAGGTNNWGQVARISPSDGTVGNSFGISLSLQDDKLLVGARYGIGMVANSGAVYLYEEDPENFGQWNEKVKFIAEDGANGDEFGRDVSLFGNVIVVGAFYKDDLCPLDPNCNSGAAYIYAEILATDVFINKSVSDSTALPGQPITYTVTFGNSGPDIAFDTIITDELPAIIQNPQYVSSGTLITPTSSVPFAWQVGDMAPGTGGIITITGIVSSDLTTGTTLVNSATITNSMDVTQTNNVDTAVSQVVIPGISFSQSEYTVDEGAGAITLTAVLSPAQPFLDVFVDYYTVNGTAVAGEDYTTTSNTMVFPQGITETTFMIPILNDDIEEPNENFLLNLVNPVHAQIQSSPISITIVDDDVSLEESYVFLPVIVKPSDEPELTFPVFIGDPIESRLVSSQGEVFYTITVQIPETIPVEGQFLLSAQPDSVQEIVVDDELVFLLGGEEIFAYTFSEATVIPQPTVVEVPRSVMLEMAGQEVTVIYLDVFGGDVYASEIWIQHVP